MAQEGHPLVGTWHGTWGPNANERHDVTLVLEYDGKAITGHDEPGPDSVRFDKVTLDPSNWSVRMEATPKGTPKAGADRHRRDHPGHHQSLPFAGRDLDAGSRQGRLQSQPGQLNALAIDQFEHFPI